MRDLMATDPLGTALVIVLAIVVVAVAVWYGRKGTFGGGNGK